LPEVIRSVRPAVVRLNTSKGTGSGFIFEVGSDSSALVFTNKHVVSNSRYVDVTVNDSKTYQAKVLGVDATRDLAVLKICCGAFQVLTFMDAAKLEAGTEVIAMGYPLGLPGNATVTKGIISTVKYHIGDERWIIQIDAPINPGNSGGPLLSLDGQVVGINTFRIDAAKSGRAAEGLGFAVSEQTVRRYLPVLK